MQDAARGAGCELRAPRDPGEMLVLGSGHYLDRAGEQNVRIGQRIVAHPDAVRPLADLLAHLATRLSEAITRASRDLAPPGEGRAFCVSTHRMAPARRLDAAW